MNGKKRTFDRLALHAKAYIHRDDQYIEGVVENFSFKGAFVTTARQMGINDEVALTIENTSPGDLKAKVVRVTDKGMGLQFIKTRLVENGT